MTEEEDALKELDEATEEIEDDLNYEEIEPQEDETCECGIKWRLLYYPDVDEVYYVCRMDRCESFYITLQEFEYERKDRNKARKNNSQTPSVKKEYTGTKF